MRIPDQLLPGPSLSGRYHLAVVTETGPTATVVPVSTLGQFEAVFGPRTAATAAGYDDLAVFLAEGGGTAWVTGVAPGSTPAQVAAALDATSADTAGGCVAAPGFEPTAMGEALIQHAAAHRKVALLATGAHATAEEAAALAAHLSTRPGGDCAGLFWPWVTHRLADGRTRTVAPTGYAAAARARAHKAVGYWQHPGGLASTARRLTGTAVPCDRAMGWELGEDLVSAVCTGPDGSVALAGWWSLGGDRSNFPHLTTRDLLNNTALELGERYAALSASPWGTVSRYTSQVIAATRAVCSALAARGALTPSADPEDLLSADRGYAYTITPDYVAEMIDVAVALRPLQYARLVGLELIRVPLHLPLPAPAGEGVAR